MAKQKIDKKDLANRFTEQVMREIGLEVGNFGSVIDQDTGASLQLNGKKLKYRQGDRPPILHLSDMMLNPIGDVRQMRNLFSHYMNKVEQEGDERVPGMFFSVPESQDKSSITLQYTDQSGILQEIKSKGYYNESICYADVIMQYNGEPNVNLDEFDFPLEQPKRQSSRR